MKWNRISQLTIIILTVSIIFNVSCNDDEELEPQGFNFNPDVLYDSVSDIESNYYHTLEIDTITWMAENLRVTKLNDGTPIPEITDDKKWSELYSPAFCYYNNSEAKGELYGSLYNWYTVETEKLCPAGWHVPTSEEWNQLEKYLIENGYNFDGTTEGNKISKSLASGEGWRMIVQDGVTANKDYPEYINKTGFTAVPGGHREEDGFFIYSSVEGEWWSSTKDGEDKALYRFIFNNDYSFGHESGRLNRGASVRCVKD
ncbi:MAG: fibrobacter succinogenes major paralogous domain-containing protein [Prolixibacteraceae bacterium]|nr:fibrobacter succinogenes major paralogous domain-containing protein [Prolixibacteraceae bacterium]